MVSNSGTWLQSVTGSVYVYDRTGSALAVGLLNFATFMPVLLFSVWGGSISDRFDRRAIVIVTHVASLVVGVGLGVAAARGAASVLVVMVAAFLLQTAWSIAKPSLTAMINDLVDRDELTEAVGLNTLQFVVGQLVGPVSATVILATAGPAWAFGLNGVSYLAPIAAMLYLVRIGVGAGAGRAPARRAEAGIMSYLREESWVLYALGVVVCTSAIFEVIRTTAPAIAAVRLAEPTSTAGLIVAAQSTGSAIGILALGPLRRRGLTRSLSSVGLVLQAAGLLALTQATALPAAVAATIPMGIGFSLCFPVVTGALQGEVPNAMRGRLMSIHQMALLGHRPFTALAAGAIAAAFGPPAALVAVTALVPFGLVAIRTAWRRLVARPATEAVAVAAG